MVRFLKSAEKRTRGEGVLQGAVWNQDPNLIRNRSKKGFGICIYTYLF